VVRAVRTAADLPVLDVLDDAVEAAATARRLVLEAPAGAGKTTALPLALAEDPRFDHGRIVVLEPRRVAARAAARRMASLVGDRLGGHVGVTTRDDRHTSSSTRVEVVTEGVLVNRLQADPGLRGVSCVVLDEFHERSLQADLSLAFSLDVADALRDDLAVVVMSATLEGERVAELLGDAPVVSSDGRLHAVTIEHREHSLADRLEPAVAAAVRAALDDHDGDVLVFLPGVGEIRRTMRELAGTVGDDVRLLPLHGGLPPAEQDAAISPAPAGLRHVVLSTDLAESSLTVPGVRVVVDAGLAREPRFDPDTGLSTLVTTRVSQDRAAQRAGRAGRVAPGTAVRLWPRRDHGALPPRRTPAVLQEDLAGYVLEAARWGVTDPSELRVLDPPPARSWAAGVALLRGLRAIDGEGRLTESGAGLAALPLPPRLAHLVASAAPGDRALAADLAAVLVDRDLVSVRDHVDLASRVRVLRGGAAPGGARVRDGAVARARRDAQRLDRVAGGAGSRRTGPVVDADVGRLLVRAFPDRVARRRAGEARGRFVLASGRGVVLGGGDPLAGEELLVVADLDGGDVDARAFLAAGVTRDDLEGELGHLVQQVAHVAWDPAAGDVVTERRTVLAVGGSGLVLSSGHLDAPPDAATTEALLAGLRDRGLGLLPWSRAAGTLRERATFLHDHLGAPWPAMDDTSLLDELETWLAPWLTGLHRVGHLARTPLLDALRGRIGWDLARRVDELAPDRLAIPSGRTAAVRYDPDAGPVIAAKLQEFFGATTTPTVAGGAVPVTIELLTPAGRPTAVTSDLPGFWAGAYADVRAELRGRYPKHPWPEDPTTASPTARTKRRS
jgi:ATP-dependent helicase HrpB